MLLTPGCGHLSLKAPLCWGQLNHSKDDQPSNIRKLGWLPYKQCLHIITLRESDCYGTDWVRLPDLLGCTKWNSVNLWY